MLLNKMQFGAIAFNVPEAMNIDQPHQFQLIASLAKSVEQLKRSIAEQGKKIGATIKVSDRMEARLSGHMFQITAITPEVQAMSTSRETGWKWQIYPKSEGKHTLHLTLTALLDVNGHSTPRAIRTFDRTIDVRITGSQKARRFFNDNWQWLWAALLVPLAGWLWQRRKKVLDSFNR